MIRRRGYGTRRRVIFADELTGSTLDSGWKTESGYGGWSLTGTGLAQPANSAYPKIARSLPTPLTNVTCEAIFPTVTADPNTGAGVILQTSADLLYTAGWFVYVGTSGWQVWRNDNQVTSGSLTSSAPVSVAVRIAGGQFALIINRGTPVYTAAATETVHGIGLVQANTQTSTRCDRVEAR